MIIVSALVLVWAVRLAIHIGMRKNGQEDYRYKKWREDWQAEGQCNYYLKAFFIVYMLQSVFSIIVNSSALFVNIFSIDNDIEWTDYLGIIVWLAGFLIEVIADA